MSGGFEKAFQAFVLSQQDKDLLCDDNNNEDGDEGSIDDSKSGENHAEVPINTCQDQKRMDSQRNKPIPKLKLMVDPNYVADEKQSPYSLKRYIRSPNSHVVKFDSFSNSVVHTSNVHTSNFNHHKIHQSLTVDTNTRSHQPGQVGKSFFPKKANFQGRRVLKKPKNSGTHSPNSRLKVVHQRQAVLKKYGLRYPVKRAKDKIGFVGNVESVQKPFAKVINFNPILNKEGSDVNKSECDSHYFCAQGEGLSRNSPEAAKSVISSPANASVGESSLTDTSISPLHDSTVCNVTSSEYLYSKDAETENSVLDSIGLVDAQYKCDNYQKSNNHSKENRFKKQRRNTVCTDKETDVLEVVSHHLTHKFGNQSTRRERGNTNRRKRNYSEILDPDFVLKTSEEDQCEYGSERNKRLRTRRNSSCLCCSSKASKHVRRQSLKCNIADYKYLSIQDQNFISNSIQLSNIKSKLHSLFCSVFPKLIPILHSVTPESHQFYVMIEDILLSLQTSDDEELEEDTVNVVNLLEGMHLKSNANIVPIFYPSVRLCQNPEQCLEMFRDKVVNLLQLLLPSLIISLDNFISSTRELEKFLDKMISSNYVK